MRLTFLPLCLLAAPLVAQAPPTRPQGKPGAPVAIHAQLGTRSAVLDLAFQSEAEGAELKVWGLDGLVVESCDPLPRRSFRRGESVTVKVQFTPGPTASHLAVAVAGQFQGRRQQRLQTFALGDLAQALRARAPKTQTLPGGARAQVAPVRPQGGPPPAARN